MNTKNIEVIQPIQPQPALAAEEVAQDNRPFMTSPKTILMPYHKIEEHVVPVFYKDNQELISQRELIDLTRELGQAKFPSETILKEKIMVSHIQKNRIPSAIGKPKAELLPTDETIRYNRAAWFFEFPNIRTDVDGKPMTLVLGGIKSYENDNLEASVGRRIGESFKFFIGFKVNVCLNMCIWSDGYAGEIRAKDIHEMEAKINEILVNYVIEKDIERMQQLNKYALTENEFATFLGKCRLYSHKPTAFRNEVPEMIIQDNQFNAIAKGYSKDKNFAGTGTEISMWNCYNLLTDAVKNSYIGDFMDRNVNAGQLIEGLIDAKEDSTSPYNWYLN